MHTSASPSSHVPSWFQREAPSGEPRVLDLGRLLLGLVVVAFGVLFLLDAAGVLNADRAANHFSVRSTPILGGLDDKTDHSEPLPPDAPTLHVDALAVLGGVDIKHEK